MEEYTEPFETLKQILRQARDPKSLDEHPWAGSLVVQESLAKDPVPGQMSPGQQLMRALAGLFTEMQPSTPPRRGKRLDPRWGEFGLLAALYFTPFRYGVPFPTSLLDAWRRIDAAILYQVYGQPAALLTREQVQEYRLVGEEADYGSASTLSDWHRKGVQRLAEILLNRERYLSSQLSQPVVHAGESKPVAQRTQEKSSRKWLVLASVVLLLAAVLFVAGLQGWKLYQGGRAVYADVLQLQGQVPNGLELERIEAAYPSLLMLMGDLGSLEQQAKPWIPLSRRLGWVPVHGGDLSSAGDLLQMSGHLLTAADLAYQGSSPLLQQLGSQGSDLDPAGLTALLVAAQPQFTQARLELDQSRQARSSIDTAALSPQARELLQKVDPVLARMDEGLSLVTALPILLGASAEGPKTYLLLVQNEDELRPTGGFITAVGRLVLDQGQVISLEFEPVEDQDDWSKPYPAAPWQMREFMNSRVMLLRDSNWSPDFPASARLAETLYAYNHDLSVDGVIAFDQHFLVLLLGQLGPLTVEGAEEPVTAATVIPYMRAAKEVPAGQPAPQGWNRKQFISKLASAILTRLVTGKHYQWREIAAVLSQALEERHLLLQFDHPHVADLLARHGWQNSVQAGAGDYLLVTDTNMGFNKTNAVVEQRLAYSVDLTDLSAPRSELTVTHNNHARPDVPCFHWNNGRITEEGSYPIDRCYWSYLRVYKQAGTQLLEATPMQVPGSWMLLGRDVPARVDKLEESLPGVDGLGTFLVVPGGHSLESRFQYSMPAGTLIHEAGSNLVTYRLKVQKQPGTLGVPVEIRVRLPANGSLQSVSPGATTVGNEVLFISSLRTDVFFDLVFSLE